MSEEGGGGLLLIGAVVVGLWYWQGDPPKDVANWFYKEGPAPWETVDAFYYPNRNDLSVWRTGWNLKDLDACRDWVSAEAYNFNDPNIERGDYECGVGKPYLYSGFNVYRLTVQ